MVGVPAGQGSRQARKEVTTVYDPESLYAWAQERQEQLRREAARRRLLRLAQTGGPLLRIRLPFFPRHHV